MNSDSSSKSHIQPLRSRLKEVTKQAILEAAETTFAEQGIHAARMEDIASSAGTAVGTLYNYFGDRNSLLEALMETRRVELLARVDEAVTGSRRDRFEDRLGRFFSALVEHLQAHRRLFTILMEEESQRQRAKERKLSSIRTVAERAGTLIQDGVRSGVLRKEDAELFSTFLMGTVRGIFLGCMDQEEPVPPGVVDALVRFFMNGARSGKA
jgi:AcrR family transcriptional regulator